LTHLTGPRDWVIDAWYDCLCYEHDRLLKTDAKISHEELMRGWYKFEMNRIHRATMEKKIELMKNAKDPFHDEMCGTCKGHDNATSS